MSENIKFFGSGAGWEDSTVTLHADFGTLTNKVFKQLRDGRMLRFKGYCQIGTAGSSSAEINLPPGLTIDASFLPTLFHPPVGWWYRLYNATPVASIGAGYSGFIAYRPGLNTLALSYYTTSTGLDTVVVNGFLATNDYLGLEFEIPIKEWA